MLSYYIPSSGNLRFPSYKGTVSTKSPLKAGPRPPGLGVDALDSVAGMPGAVSNYYGFSTDSKNANYIFGGRYLGKLQSDWSKGIKSGGNEQLVKILSNLGTSKGLNQAFVKADPTIGSKFATYFKTGKLPTFAGVNDAKRASQAYDYALRAIGADAVGDRQSSFIGSIAKSFIGPVVGSILLPGIGTALGAKFAVSSAVAGAIGGAIQGGLSNGVTGAIFGAAGGYNTGSFIGNIGNHLSTAAHAIGKPAWGAAVAPKLTSVNAHVAKSFMSPSFAARTGLGVANSISPWSASVGNIATAVTTVNVGIGAAQVAKSLGSRPKAATPTPIRKTSTSTSTASSRPNFLSALLSERSRSRINYQRNSLGKTNFTARSNSKGLIKRRVF